MIHSYAQAIDHLAGGRDKNSRPVANNTRVERRGDDIAIKLHATDVATIHPDNSITLNSGGWLTVTTKDRMNSALRNRSVTLGSWHGAWFIYGCVRCDRGIRTDHPLHDEAGPSWEKLGRYFDGITISDLGEILNPRDNSLEVRLEEAERKMIKSVDGYLDGYFEAMEAGTMPLPSGGDCWDCSMIVSDGKDKGKPLGDVRDGDHLWSHIKERYYVPSLLWNATKAPRPPLTDTNFVMTTRLDREAWENDGLMRVRRAWQSDQPDRYSVKELRRDLRKYLRRRLIPTLVTQ